MLDRSTYERARSAAGSRALEGALVLDRVLTRASPRAEGDAATGARNPEAWAASEAFARIADARAPTREALARRLAAEPPPDPGEVRAYLVRRGQLIERR